MKEEKIVAERLILRHFRLDDAEEMFSNWANDPDVTKYMTWLPHEDISVTKSILNLWIKEYEKPETHRFGITLKESGELIGSIDVVNYVDGVPEIGYCSAKKCWNKGYMTEACKAFIEYLFDLGFNEIVIEAHVDNIGSNRVIQKCGFKFTHKETRPISEVRPELVTVNWYKITK